MQLLRLLEQEEYDQLDYRMKNTRMAFSRGDCYHEFEKHLLSMISRLVKARSNQDKMDCLSSYKELFLTLKNDPCNQGGFRRFDICWWIDQKISEQGRRSQR